LKAHLVVAFVETIPMYLFFCMPIPFIQKLWSFVKLKFELRKRQNVQGWKREKESKSVRLNINILKWNTSNTNTLKWNTSSFAFFFLLFTSFLFAFEKMNLEVPPKYMSLKIFHFKRFNGMTFLILSLLLYSKTQSTTM
jgi:hypothetical protein